MSEVSSNKLIAKNTIILYMRMIVSMVVTLYTSRVILKVIGIEDYGIYQAVCGIVGFLVFINNALSTGTSRFLTFALGENNTSRLKKIFSTTLTCHIIIALLVVVIAETIGIYIVENRLIIPYDRLAAAISAYHYSIASTALTLVMVPYSAVIIARERMSFFAYICIIEVLLKLLIVYALNIGDADKLILYAQLFFCVQLAIFISYFAYCRCNFIETKSGIKIDIHIFKEIIGFSVWSLFSGCSTALNNHGIIILLNIFFNSPIVVARTISLQVNSAISQFISNFRTAVNPQIVKRLAIGNRESSQKLLLASTKYSFYLMYIICLPLYILTPNVLDMWLDEVPEYTIVFTKLILVQTLFQVFDTSFYTALYAEGKLKANALISPTLGFLMFPIVYILFKLNYSPIVLSWVFILFYAFLGLIVKPLLIVKIAFYKWRDILDVFKSCIKITVVSLPLPLLFSHYLAPYNIFDGMIIIIISVISIIVTIWCIDVSKEEKQEVINFISKKLA